MIDFLLEHSPPLLVAVPLFAAFLTPVVGRLSSRVRDGIVLLSLAFSTFLSFLLAQDIYKNGIRVYTFGAKIPSLTSPAGIPIRIIFEVDGLSIFMAIVSLTIALLAAIYSMGFIKKEEGADRYYTLLLLMVVGMIGLELTGDMFNFFVFLEITSIASCALIAFWIDRPESLEASFKYIIISAIGALFVLLAVAFLYGQYDLLNIGALANAIKYTFIDKIALVLLLVALAMKAGVAPMHMWLPDAYGEAPPSVTFAIIAATQASLYGVIRVCYTLYSSMLNPTVIGSILIGLAIISIIVGVTMAIIQKSITRSIAYIAVAEIGYMLLAVGTGLVARAQAYAVVALKGGIFHIFNDALDLGLLFLCAGAVIFCTRERTFDRLGGLARNMKYTSMLFLVGLLAVSGMPPMNGFASKLLIYESTYQFNPILAIVAILGSILILAVFAKIFYSIFLGPELPHLKNVRDAPAPMLVAMFIVTAIIIFFSLFPGYVIDTIVSPAVNAMNNPSSYIGAIIKAAGGV